MPVNNTLCDITREAFLEGRVNAHFLEMKQVKVAARLETRFVVSEKWIPSRYES